MRSRLSDRRLLPHSILVGMMLAVAGCQSGDSASALDVANQPPKTTQKVTEAELRGYCPRVTLRDGTSFFNTYAKGGQDDPTKIVYQASMADVTRTCSTVDGQMTMNVAIAGRIVPGPVFTPGTVTLPIRVAVMHGEEVLYSQIHKYPVSVSDPSAATQFVFNDPNVNFVQPADRAIRVFAGFDEGPAKTAAR